MLKKNICKFPSSYITNSLAIESFVFESDKETMKLKTTLSSNRMILTTSGKCVFHFNKEIVKSSVGSIVFGFKGESFFAEPYDTSEYMYIHFDGIRSTEIFNRFNIDEQNRIFEGYNGVIPLWKESLSHANDLTIDLAAESILLYTFSKFVSEATLHESTVGKMIEITKEQFTAPSLSINFLSEKLSYNPKYLSHLFKETTGIGYTEYLRDMRLKFAISLMENGVDSIKNVALLSGFSDPLYFSTIFKNKVGITPKAYKENLR